MSKLLAVVGITSLLLLGVLVMLRAKPRGSTAESFAHRPLDRPLEVL